MSSEERTSPEGGADPSSGQDGITGLWGRRVIGVCAVIAAVVAVVGQILGLWTSVFSHDGSGATPPAASASASTGSVPECGRPGIRDVVVRLEGKPTSSGAHVIATVTCEIGLGDHLSWVVSKETGGSANPHVRFTLRFDLGQQGPGEYPFDSILDSTTPGSQRTISVVLMDDATYRTVKASTDPETNYVQLPSSVPVVSNSLLVTTPE
jgi:hypothetical protein